MTKSAEVVRWCAVTGRRGTRRDSVTDLPDVRPRNVSTRPAALWYLPRRSRREPAGFPVKPLTSRVHEWLSLLITSPSVRTPHPSPRSQSSTDRGGPPVTHKISTQDRTHARATQTQLSPTTTVPTTVPPRTQPRRPSHTTASPPSLSLSLAVGRYNGVMSGGGGEVMRPLMI